MPKLKGHKASNKRFKVTGTGKVMAHPTGARHVMSGKKSKKRRHMRRMRPLKSMDRMHTLRQMHLPTVPKKQPTAAAPKTEGA